MSSTNRGYERHKADYYITPANEIKNFLNEWFVDMQEEANADPALSYIADRPDRVRWFDPCAGGSQTDPMAYPSVITKEFDAYTDTMDIREDSLADEKADYLTTDISHRKYDVIITNPPFYLAKEIVQKALKDVSENGYVVMLLRLNFLGSKDRFNFWQDNMPERIYVHHKRMSFTKNGGTDSIEYAHFVWQKGKTYTSSKLKVI